MALERVLMWDNNKGWKPISAEKAAELCRGGRVSANSGIFMCGKCHKYVYFADGKVRGRFFGHSRGDDDKECEDRIQYFDDKYNAFEDPKYVIKINVNEVNRKNKRFSFSIGLMLPKADFVEGTFKIDGNTFNFSRFEGRTFEYFDVGEIPTASYKISTGSVNIPTFPKEIKFMDNGLALFKADSKGESGKLLPEWAYVQSKTEYFLLSKGQFLDSVGTSVTRISKFEQNGYYLYSIKADCVDKSASDFFHDSLHCILAQKTPEIYPIWPVYWRNPYIMFHNSDRVFLLLQGNDGEPKIFPNQKPIYNKLDVSDSTIATVWSAGADRQQILALNQYNPKLKQLIMWRSSSDDPIRTVKTPDVVIKDMNGSEISDVTNYELPRNGELRIKTEYDGFILRFKNNILYEKYKIKSDVITPLYKTEFGDKFEIYQGCDKIKTIEFVRKASGKNFDDETFVKKLSQCSGDAILIPYNLSGVVLRLKGYPETQGWLRKIIRKGCISEKAFKLLKKFVSELEYKND